MRSGERILSWKMIVLAETTTAPEPRSCNLLPRPERKKSDSFLLRQSGIRLVIAACSVLLIVMLIPFETKSTRLDWPTVASADAAVRQGRFENQRAIRMRRNSTQESSIMKSRQQNSQINQKRTSTVFNSTQQKRFKTATSGINLGSIRLSDSQNLIAFESRTSRNDLNNNSDVNNNNNPSANSIDDRPVGRSVNVNSVNGTIDLSQYGQNDVDRLYGDALLVYFKNFNE